jgi:hypothetical protein
LFTQSSSMAFPLPVCVHTTFFHKWLTLLPWREIACFS